MNLPGLVCLAAYDAECRVAKLHARDPESNMIRDIEELASKLQVVPAIIPESVVLEYAQIEVVRAMPPCVGQSSGRGAKCVGRRLAEDTRVEPSVEAARGIAFQLGARSVIIGTGIAAI